MLRLTEIVFRNDKRSISANTNLNDYSKTEIMKNITFINRQSDVLNDVLKDCEIEKLKQQCEN